KSSQRSSGLHDPTPRQTRSCYRKIHIPHRALPDDGPETTPPPVQRRQLRSRRSRFDGVDQHLPQTHRRNPQRPKLQGQLGFETELCRVFSSPSSQARDHLGWPTLRAFCEGWVTPQTQTHTTELRVHSRLPEPRKRKREWPNES